MREKFQNWDPGAGGWRLLMINDDDTFVCLLLLGCLGCERSEAEATVRKRHRLLYEHTNTDTHTEKKNVHDTHAIHTAHPLSRRLLTGRRGGGGVFYYSLCHHRYDPTCCFIPFVMYLYFFFILHVDIPLFACYS